jgi:hypothetical protein
LNLNFGGGFGAAPPVEDQWANDPLNVLVRHALQPVMHLDESWTLDTAEKRIVQYFWKTGKQFEKDERLSTFMPALSAQALIYDFVATIMGAVSAGCYDKAWYWEANWSPVLNYWCEMKLGDSKALRSVVKPLIERYIEESFTRIRDEERIGKAIEGVLQNSGLPDGHYSKCRQFLTKTFEEAHKSAPYGQSQNPDPALRMLEDFFFGWIKDFTHRAGHLLEEGVGETEQQLVFTASLFQALAGPNFRVMPYDAQQLFALDESKLPGPEWTFIQEAVVTIAQQAVLEAGGAAAKKLRLGMETATTGI